MSCSEMVERVARALADANGYDWNGVDQPWHDKGIPTQEQYRTMARAAIEAMREPTEGMLFRAEVMCDHKMVWQAMIDEALKP